MLCDDPGGWDAGEGESEEEEESPRGERLKREVIYIYLKLIHVVVQQKLTQYCKANILQLKI